MEDIESRLRSIKSKAGCPSRILAYNNFIVTREEYEVWNSRILGIISNWTEVVGAPGPWSKHNRYIEPKEVDR